MRKPTSPFYLEAEQRLRTIKVAYISVMFKSKIALPFLASPQINRCQNMLYINILIHAAFINPLQKYSQHKSVENII